MQKFAKSKQSGIQTITAIIPVKNEEKNISRCIESLAWCDDIMVMDMGTDQTAQVAKKLGARVFKMGRSKKDDFMGLQKNINWAIDHCSTDWILRIDADEVVTPELRKEIAALLHGSIAEKTMKQWNNETIKQYVAYGIPRKQYFLGAFLKGGDWAYDRLVRFFRRGFAYYDPLVSVHEQFKVKGKIGVLKHPLLHYSHPTVHELFRKFNSYTTVQIYDLNDSIFSAVFKMIFLPPYIFLRWNVWHLGIRDGWRGIVAGLLRAWYEFTLYKKYIAYRLK